MKEKLFLENDNAYFLVQVFHEKINEEFDWIIIKTKEKGQTMKGKLPIVGLYITNQNINFEDDNLSSKNFKFREWVIIKPKSGHKYSK